MESINYPAGWYEAPETEHHPLCKVNDGWIRCDCAMLELADEINAEEAKAAFNENR